MSLVLQEDQGPLLRAFGILINKFPEDERTRSPADFVDLKFNAGADLNIPVFSPDKIEEIWELFATMKELGLEETYLWLRNTVVPRKEEIERRGIPEVSSIIGTETPILNDLKKREKVAIALEQDVGTLSDIRSCGKCQNEKTYFRVVQDRKADEGPSSVFTCPRCNFCWKEG